MGIGSHLSIGRKPDSSHAYTTRDLTILLNGEPIPGLVGLTLNLAHDSVNQVTLNVRLDGVDIDADTLVALEAMAKRPDEDGG